MRTDITRMLAEISDGQHDVADDLFAAVYDELKSVAHHQLARSQGNMFDTTGLVHELYLKISDAKTPSYNDRRHFFAVAAQAMRYLVVDAIRKRTAVKRGGSDWMQVTFDESALGCFPEAESMLALDEALDQLKSLDPSLVELVEMRYFAALAPEEIAKLRGVTPRTVFRDWSRARAFLFDAMGSPR